MPLDVRRLLAHQCTRCGEPNPDRDTNLCAECTRDGSSRQAALRARRRKQKKCVYCGKRSKTRRCRSCTRKKRRGVTKRSRGVDQANHVTEQQLGGKVVTKVEVDSRYADGRVRQRYVGRGSRGAPSRQQLEADDVRGLRIALRELEKAIALVEKANQADPDMPRIQREELRREALAPAGLAGRLIDEVLDRNKFGH